MCGRNFFNNSSSQTFHGNSSRELCILQESERHGNAEGQNDEEQKPNFLLPGEIKDTEGEAPFSPRKRKAREARIWNPPIKYSQQQTHVQSCWHRAVTGSAAAGGAEKTDACAEPRATQAGGSAPNQQTNCGPPGESSNAKIVMQRMQFF